MYKVSASQLDTIRKYQEGEYDLNDVKERFTSSYSSSKMNIGTSFHSLIEVGDEWRRWIGHHITPPVYAGYNFVKSEVINFIKWLNLPPTSVHEYKERVPFEIKDEKWLLTCKCDILTPYSVIDIKTTYSAYDWESYYNSAQWKAYCLAFEVDTFEYRVAVMKLDATLKLATIKEARYLETNRSQVSDDAIYEIMETLSRIRRQIGLNMNATEEEWEERTPNLHRIG